MFTNKDVMALRAKTGVGMMDCKKALSEADGDMDKAVEILREKGMATANKRAGKIASQGIVAAYKEGNVGLLLEVNCESDFVARGEQFKEFIDSVAKYIIEKNPANIEAVLADSSVADMLHDAIAKIGEKIDIRRFTRYEGNIETYIHMGGKIGVMIDSTCSADVAHDVALQIAAANPGYIKRDEVPTGELEKEKEILRAQALNEGKPEKIVDKMVEGRINKFYKEVCLIEQPFVKNPDQAVKDILNGGEVFKFVRYEMGEGLAKKEENLANEVEEQIAKAKQNN